MYKQSKTKLRKQVNQAIYSRHRHHYLKYNAFLLDGTPTHWSIRYIFTYDSNHSLVGTWILKHHKSKTTIPLLAGSHIHWIHHFTSGKPMEIHAQLTKSGYRKSITYPNGTQQSYIDKGDRAT